MFNCREELTAAEITAEEAKVAEEEALDAAWAAAEEREAREVEALRLNAVPTNPGPEDDYAGDFYYPAEEPTRPKPAAACPLYWSAQLGRWVSIPED